MSGEPWQLVEIFLKDFLRDVGGTLRGRCRGNLRGCRGNLGGTLGSTFPYHFLRDVGGTFGDVRDIWVSGEPWGNLGQHFSLSFLKGCPGNLRGCPGHLSGGCPGNRRGRDSIFLKDFLRDVGGTLRGRCRGNLRRCRGNLGGTLGSTFLKDFLRDVGGTLLGGCRGILRRCRGNLGGTYSPEARGAEPLGGTRKVAPRKPGSRSKEKGTETPT